MKKFLSATFIGLTLSTSALASTWWSPSRLYTGAYSGYGNVEGAYKNDGQVTVGRFVLGLHLANYPSVSWGAEMGIQSGNTMRLEENPNLEHDAGDLPEQSTLKPFIDFLATVKIPLLCSHPLFGMAKAGVAYRQLQIEASSSSRDTIRKISPELQLGLGYNITPQFMLSAFYQGIYAGDTAGITSNTPSDTPISRIPTQQSGFIGLEYTL